MIRLRKITKNDLEKIRKWRMHPEVSKYMVSNNTITSEDQIRWFNNIKNDKSCNYWIIQYNLEDIGLISISDVNFNDKNCTWGYYIADLNMRGKGIGKNLECSLHDYVFNELNLHKLYGDVVEGNQIMLGMHKRFGYKIEGIFRDQIRRDNKYINIIKVGLLKDEWNSIRETFKYPFIEFK